MSKEMENNRAALENGLASEGSNRAGKAAMESKARQAQATTTQAGTLSLVLFIQGGKPN